jgi:nitrite reductase/ring-hydroxylating ferredoxin subunit
MGFFKRLFGICSTSPPADAGCWNVADGKVTVDLARASELANPGGAIRLEGGALPKRILVFRGDDGQVRAMENRCSHVGHRRLDPVVGQGIIRCCSIGRSEFDYEGRRLAGAAQGPIRPLKVETDGQMLVISLA